MTRLDCELKVLDLMGQIADVCKQYIPGERICISVNGEYRSAFSINDATGKEMLSVTHYENGTVKIGDKFVGCEE